MAAQANTAWTPGTASSAARVRWRLPGRGLGRAVTRPALRYIEDQTHSHPDRGHHNDAALHMYGALLFRGERTFACHRRI
jgi:hypothetical protein